MFRVARPARIAKALVLFSVGTVEQQAPGDKNLR